ADGRPTHCQSMSGVSPSMMVAMSPLPTAAYMLWTVVTLALLMAVILLVAMPQLGGSPAIGCIGASDSFDQRIRGRQCKIWLRNSLVRSCCGCSKNSLGSLISMI